MSFADIKARAEAMRLGSHMSLRLTQVATDRAELVELVEELAKQIKNFIGFAEYHELEKGNPRLQLQMLGMRAALAKVQS